MTMLWRSVLTFTITLSSAVASTTMTAEELTDLRTLLLDGDDRLLRFDVWSDSGFELQSEHCPKKIPDLVATVIDTKAPVEDRAVAMEVMAFCTTERPEHRKLLAATGNNLHIAVVKLLSSGKDAAAASAGELIYLSSFASPENHKAWVDAGAVDELAKLVPSAGSSYFSSTPPAPIVTMFALAAMQNLAASYCGEIIKADEGEPARENEGELDVWRCDWYWDWSGEGKFMVHPEAPPVVIDSEPVRLAISKMPGLADKAKGWACEGPVKEDQTVTPHPGESKREDAMTAVSIIPWAAVGLLKNLALSDEVRPTLKTATLDQCLCYLVDGFDWLEQEKALETFHNLGREEPCKFYEEDGVEVMCIDRDWFNSDNKESCADFLEIDCESAGDWLGVDGKTTANDACCVCGGGDSYPQNKGDEL